MASRRSERADELETTGHEWDGIRELNKPLPKWWLYTFYACVVWAFGYLAAHAGLAAGVELQQRVAWL